jgi:hypothetical protein
MSLSKKLYLSSDFALSFYLSKLPPSYVFVWDGVAEAIVPKAGSKIPT